MYVTLPILVKISDYPACQILVIAAVLLFVFLCQCACEVGGEVSLRGTVFGIICYSVILSCSVKRETKNVLGLLWTDIQ